MQFVYKRMGKLLLQGQMSQELICSGTVGRFNSNGTLDTTFGNNGIAIVPINHSSGHGDKLQDLAIQSDNKIVTAGYVGDSNVAVVVRQNTDGSLDQSFGTGGIVKVPVAGAPYVRARAVTLQPDEKIVVFGEYTDGTSTTYLFTYRFNANGSADTTFGTNGLVTELFGTADFSRDVVVQADGKIITTGSYTPENLPPYSELDQYVLRYNTDGTRDTAFGTGGVALNLFPTDMSGDRGVSSLAVQADGKIIFSGSYLNGGSISFGIGRLNTNGSIDASFGSNGVLTTPVGTGGSSFINALALQTDGRMLAAGAASNGSYYDFALARFFDPNLNETPVVNPLSNATINEGATYTASGSFTDATSTSWTGTVDYGDGTGEHAFAAPNESIDPVNHTFTISHVYKDNQAKVRVNLRLLTDSSTKYFHALY